MSEANRIEAIHVSGFRSLADVQISGLGNKTVLIGANGAGKSNFIRFFEMLSWMLRSRRLDEFIQRQGGADDQLYRGRAVTSRIRAEISLKTQAGRNDYRFQLVHAHPDRFVFTEEAFRFTRADSRPVAEWRHLRHGGSEAMIVEAAQATDNPTPGSVTARTIVGLLRNCSVYQFHDTSDSSNMKSLWDADDNAVFRSHGGNLAAILYRLEHEDIKRFELICRQIGRVLPVFDRFQIEESGHRVTLRWKARGVDKTFGPHLTSDGSLRLFALVTLLNLPPHMLPDILLLDEPELGLHPSAIALIGGMISALATDRQVIVATQSPLLVDAFDLEEIFVLDLEDGQTVFRNLRHCDYKRWLEEGFTTGDLWRKNIIGGRP